MARAIRAAQQSGLRVNGAEIDQQARTLKLTFGDPPKIDLDRDEWDEVLPKPDAA